MRYVDYADSAEDIFADSRMSFGDHLEELRRYMWRALVGFGVILVLVFVCDFLGYATSTPVGIGKPVMELISAPVEQELQRFYDRRAQRIAREMHEGKRSVPDTIQEVPIDLEVQELARALAPFLGLPPPAPAEPEAGPKYLTLKGRIPPAGWAPAIQEAERHARRPSLKTMSVTEAMMIYFQVALGCGVVLGSPWILGQIWAFVAAGLYPHEKRLVHVYLPFSLGLFLAGVLVCQFLVIPKAIEALLWFNEWLDLEPDLRLNEWLGFAILMPLVFGISFQTPLVMRFVERLGIVTVDDFRRKRRLAWFLLAIFAAVITPTTDPQSLLLLWLPTSLLYELGIWLCRLSPRGSEDGDGDGPEAGVIVEV